MTRFLKQRKGIQQTKQNKAMPTSNYYHFKYNFMPESVDVGKPGVVELTRKDFTAVRMERASQQSDEVHVFRGKEEPAKEVECVLVFDPESGMYTLEKLDSSLILSHEGRGPPKVRQPSASPLPNTPSPAASTMKVDEDELFRELESTLAGGNVDDDDIEDMPLSVVSKARKEEPSKPVASSISNGKPKPILQGSGKTLTGSTSKPKLTKPSPLASSLAQPPSGATYSTSSPDKGKTLHTQAHTIDVEEEVLEFGKPTLRTERPRISPQPGPSPISLPGRSSSNGLALPSTSGAVSLPGPVSGQDDEDDGEGWDVVASIGDGANASNNGDDGSIFGDNFADADEGEEINVDQFAAEMDQELLEGLEEEDADGEMEEFGVAEEPARELKPMSLNQFAGGVDVNVDDGDDDYSSSSDESDDD